ncbi:hypothetical protein QNH38_22525 [Paenibacillus polymyxa]|uniref:hypothetical protein n=1 Tax=Paenibacillus polymyxa TaxID=1406 RepID=UPI001F55B1D5|nr:hypothetical protein [Paenibacillus polymyxa]UNL94029.1 hypothetical protein CPY53_10955 [Paenibacillus polymyxa]WHX35281.1 hypothetical protein QNH38_22525 [Paenibacillus polymyxa]
MPEDVEWSSVVQKGIEAASVAFGEALGGPIGAVLGQQIASTLFDTGSEDKFANALKELQESIHQMIDKAFLDKEIGNLIGLGMNLKSYFNTRDKTILAPLQNDITQVIGNLISKNSFEALTALVYSVNIYVFTLRAQAEYISSYYQEIKRNLVLFADEIERKSNYFRAYIRTTILPPETDPLAWSVQDFKDDSVIIRENHVVKYVRGFSYKIKTSFTDQTIPYHNNYEEKRFQPYPFRGIDDSHDLIIGAYRNFNYEDVKNSKALIDCERDRQTMIKQRNEGLNKLLNPTDSAVQKWREISNVIPEAIPSI